MQVNLGGKGKSLHTEEETSTGSPHFELNIFSTFNATSFQSSKDIKACEDLFKHKG